MHFSLINPDQFYCSLRQNWNQDSTRQTAIYHLQRTVVQTLIIILTYLFVSKIKASHEPWLKAPTLTSQPPPLIPLTAHGSSRDIDLLPPLNLTENFTQICPQERSQRVTYHASPSFFPCKFSRFSSTYSFPFFFFLSKLEYSVHIEKEKTIETDVNKRKFMYKWFDLKGWEKIKKKMLVEWRELKNYQYGKSFPDEHWRQENLLMNYNIKHLRSRIRLWDYKDWPDVS